jgi:hypothetical protein
LIAFLLSANKWKLSDTHQSFKQHIKMREGVAKVYKVKEEDVFIHETSLFRRAGERFKNLHALFN